MNNTKKNGTKNYILPSIIIVLILGLCVFLLTSSTKHSLNMKFVSSGNEKTGCKTIFVDSLDEVDELSFDDGKNWQKSNYYVVCENGEVNVLGRNTDNKIIAEGNIEVTDLLEDAPEIEVNFDKEVTSLSDDSLLSGVKAIDNDGVDITDNIIFETKVSDDENHVIVKYSVSDKEGNTTTVERNIDKSFISVKLGTISYERPVYNCKPGEVIDTTITAGYGALISNSDINAVDVPVVKSYKSSNKEIATIEKSNITIKTPGMVAVKINCLKEGNVKLSATSNLGATTASDVTVLNKIVSGKLSFDKKTYNVNVNEEMNINVYGANKNDLKVTVTNDGIVSAGKLVYGNNPDEATIKITGLKEGTTKIELSSKNGEKVSATIVVKDCLMEFGSNNYQLSTGVRTLATIKSVYGYSDGILNGSLCNITKVTSSNPKVVTTLFENHLTNDGRVMFYMNPLKEGKAVITATCDTGKKITTNVTVKNKEIIKFTSSNYTLDVGENLYITVSSFNSDGTVDEIKNIEVENDIVNVKLENYDKKYNRAAATLTGVKPGTTTITAISKSGAKATAKVVVTEYGKGSISFDKEKYTCGVGQSITAVVTASRPEDYSVFVESFSSSDSTIATVVKHPNITIKSPNVMALQVNCLKAGEVSLSAKSSTGATTSSKLVVNQTVRFEKNSYSLKLGETITVKVLNPNQGEFTIKSNDESILKVGDSISYSKENPAVGTLTVKGLKSGTTKVVITNKNGGVSVASFVVKECEMTFGSSSYKMNSNQKLLATISSKYDENQLCKIEKITSSDTNVATITFDDKTPNSSGKYQFYINSKNKGSAVITATCETGKKVTSKVTVSDSPYFVNSNYTVDVNKMVNVKVFAVNQDGITIVPSDKSIVSVEAISYSKSNPNDGTVTVKGLKAGTTTLVMTDKAGNKSTTTIVVKDCDMSFSSSNYQVGTGERVAATVSSIYANVSPCKVTNITSSDESIASILYSGTTTSIKDYKFYINAKKPGSVVLTATCETGKKVTSKVTITNKQMFKFVASEYTLKKGESLYITLTAMNADGTIDEVKEIKSNPGGIVGAKHNGVNTNYNRFGVTLTGKEVGTTTITAISKSGKTTTAKVTVTE